MNQFPRPRLKLHLLAPRGFCAGVERAIKIVENALVKWGPPVYVRHEIVHNQYVVNALREKGAVFVDELDECPSGRPVVLSAHGVSKQVHAEARKRKLQVIDAVCPLVTKVHMEVRRNDGQGLQTVMIGHADHPETVGTRGQLPAGEVLLVEQVADVEQLEPAEPNYMAFVTQTTLSVDDTAQVADALMKRFPSIKRPHKSDICYATTNRQEAVKCVASTLDALFVIGSSNSSNSRRLVEVGTASGCGYCRLIDSPDGICWEDLEGMHNVGLTAGASAPEILVDCVREAFAERFELTTVLAELGKESVVFNLPREVRSVHSRKSNPELLSKASRPSAEAVR
ncbi:MAG: 4-hydroxy-3-methylbut-2-enyl diphosphate reductase [Rhodobacteraceae bacterium]|nr:4-hydroxy-3-methylbut-2-enyl diphosphate reductase [Paracoccaceae bacterium]